MTIYTAINHQVFTNEAKVFCVCQSHADALLTAKALNVLDAAQLGRAADRSAIKLLRTIRNSGADFPEDFSQEFLDEMDAVLKQAGGR
jgi:hypothetical protein